MSAKWRLDLKKDARSALRHFGFPVVGGVLLEVLNYGIELLSESSATFSLEGIKIAVGLGATAAILRLADRAKADVKKWAEESKMG